MTQAKLALITGASRGLGLSIAHYLAKEGWHLILDARGQEALQKVAEELTKITVVKVVCGDISDPEHRKHLQKAVGEYGRVDVIINNASILGLSPQPNILNYPLHVLEEVYRINLFAPIALIQDLQAFLAENAIIINVSSDAAVQAYPGWGGYGSSKAALEHISSTLSVENPQWRIYWVDPGDMQTQMHQEAFPGEDISDRPLPEESVPGFIQLISENYPSKRYLAKKLCG